MYRILQDEIRFYNYTIKLDNYHKNFCIKTWIMQIFS